MKELRAAIKLLVFVVCTLFLYSLIMLVTFGSVFGVNHVKWRGYILNLWGKLSCSILGLEMNVVGKAPEPPFFLVSNHLSYLDVFVLFSQARGVFVAKSDVKSWPLIGFLTRSCGILFIDRERKRDITRVNKLIGNNVNENQGVIMFPESKTSPGLQILPFRSSLLQYPATTNLPVTYAVISYSTVDGEEDACKTVCWWADEPFFFHFLNLLKKKKISATITFGDKPLVSPDRKSLAQALEKQIKSDFTPVIDPHVFEDKFGSLEKGKMFIRQLQKEQGNKNGQQ